MSGLSYTQTLDWLYALEARKGMDFRLERLDPVLEKLARPEKAFPSIHLAGTNGKGSTAAMLHSVYVEAGYRTGIYTSPHLFSFCERIRVGHEPIAERRVVRLVARIREACDAVGEALTFFEIATIVAFLEFQDRQVDIAVVEAGLGGRLDATNVVRSVACIITGIGLDHCSFLGDTTEAVAAEKAGVVRDSAPVIVGALDPAADDIVQARCREFDAPLFRTDPSEVGGHRVGLAGAHQTANAAIACRTIEVLSERFPVAATALERGLANVVWRGRFETRRASAPAVIVDAGHNPQAMETLVAALDAAAVGRPRALVFGAMDDKDWAQMLGILAPAVDRVYLVPVDSPRSFVPADAKSLLPADRVEVCASAADGLAAAARWCCGRGTVLVTGSIFLVAELYASCLLTGESGADAETG